MIDFQPKNKSDRIFGGVLTSSAEGFFFWYDVWLCLPADALIDVLLQIANWIFPTMMKLAANYTVLIIKGELKGYPIMFTFNQVTARILGILVWGEIIGGVIELLSRLQV